MQRSNGTARAGILCVCTANICRSPMMQLLLHVGLQERVPDRADSIDVSSAGVRARDGDRIAGYAAELLGERAIDSAGFCSRELTPELVSGADLILTASREHKSAVIALEPAARSATFTLREFAWLLGQEPVPPGAQDLPERLHQLLAVARDRRGLWQPDRPEDFDLDDPYGKRKSAFSKTLALLDATLAVPLNLLTQQNAEPPAMQTTRRSWWR